MDIFPSDINIHEIENKLKNNNEVNRVVYNISNLIRICVEEGKYHCTFSLYKCTITTKCIVLNALHEKFPAIGYLTKLNDGTSRYKINKLDKID